MQSDENRKPPFHIESGIPIFDRRLDEVEREQAEAKKRDKDYKDEQLSLDRRMVRFTGWLVLCTAIVGGINGWQAHIANRSAIAAENALTEMRQSVMLSRGQLTAATATLKSSQQIFQIDQRPYIVVDGNGPAFVEIPPSTKNPVMANVYLKNIGKAPAVQILNQVHFFAQRQRLLTEMSHQEGLEESRKWVLLLNSKFDEMHRIAREVRKKMKVFERYSVGEDLPPTQRVLITAEESFNMKDSDIPDLFSQRLQFVVIGYVTYIDTQGSNYETEYCYQFVGNLPQVWHICDAHNHVR